MILLSLVLVLASAGLLIAGLGSGDHHLIWGSMAASLCAAACLAAAVFRRRAPVPPDGGRPDTAAIPGSGPAVRGAQVPEAPAEPVRPTRPVVPPPAESPPAAEAPARGASQEPYRPVPPPDEPGEEQASSIDALRVVDLLDEVLVVDQRPRYHLPGCTHLTGRQAVPLPVSEARAAGFTPCALCHPDSTLADRARGS